MDGRVKSGHDEGRQLSKMEARSRTLLPSVKNSHHYDSASVHAIAEDVLRAKHFQDDLSVSSAFVERVSKLRVGFEQLRLGENLPRNESCEPRMAVSQKDGEPIEVGERKRRPLKLHCLCQGLKSGAPQVSSQRATLSCGAVGAPASISAH